MINNKGYIITLKDAVVGDEVLKESISSKYYIQSRNLPLILYKDDNQLEEVDTAVCPAFRMHGFLILNFNKKEENRLIDFVKNRLNNDEFIKNALNRNEIIDAESTTYSKVVEKLMKEVNEILELKLKKEDILKMSEIKIMPKEEKMTIEIPSVGIFIYSPKDVSAEREKAKDIINEIKSEGQFSKKLDIHCETFNWENGSGEREFSSFKDAIKNSIYEYNINVIILWKGFILKTDDVGFKIEEELKEILKGYQNRDPYKVWMMFYFRDSAIPQDEIVEHVYRQFVKLRKFKSEVQKKGISATYNDEREFIKKFRGYILSVLRKIEVGFRGPFPEKEVYIELNAVNSINGKPKSLIEAVDKSVESGKSVAIIGEFGTGKTTFARYYDYKKRCEWLENPHKSRLVIFLDMNEYSRKKYTMTMFKWIVDNIKHEIGFDIKRTEFEKYLNEKKMLLIFDGLDEVANIPGEDAINKSIRKINNIIHKGSPVIFTSRKTFLESEVDQRNLKDFTLLYIDNLNIEQIMDFVKKKIPEGWQNFIESVFGKKESADLSRIFEKNKEDNNPFLELVRRPLFLDMMIGAYQRGHLRSIANPADLYEVLTNDWMSEESNKKETSLIEEDIKQIIQELAFKMFLDNQFSYTVEELKEIINDILDKISNTLKQNYDHETVLEDITNISFLIRDKVEKKNFGFKHRSFVEYFTANKLASELKERNTKNFSIRILYEEIFEFLAWIMTEKSGKDEDLTDILGDPKFPFKARVNAIPPLRKQRNKKAIKPLLKAHTDIESSHPLLRFVCGYTLGIFQEKFPEEFKSQEVRERLVEAYKKEKNSLIRLRMALLLADGEYKQFEFKELNPDYEFSPSSLDEILEPSGTIEAYDKILKVNREHPIVLEESVRMLTIHVIYNGEAGKFRSTLLRYIFNFGYNHKSKKIQRISLWSMYKLGLFEPKDINRETSSIKTRAGRIVANILMTDAPGPVREMAKNIEDKYTGYFLSPHLKPKV